LPGPTSVLVVGAASRDITGEDPRGWRLGGGVTYGALTLGRLGLRVRALVGVDAEAATARELDLLRAAGVVVALVRLESGPVFEHREGPDGRRQRCLSPSDPIDPRGVPSDWLKSADAVLLAPVAGELPDGWGSAARGSLVALGWQGLLRDLAPGRDVTRRPPAASPILDAAGLVGVSTEDVPPGTDAADLLPLLAPGATLVMTAAEGGGRILRGASGGTARLDRRYPAIPSDGVIDPTGAGDVFLAAMLASLLQPSLLEGLDDPATFAAAAASLVVEGRGLLGVPDLADVRRRAARAPRRASRRPRAASSPGRGRPSQA
jgi:sugar/nucleoside kinase (ribokinase family)